MLPPAGKACASCGAANRSGAKFCKSCGVAMAPSACAECGEALARDATFCDACGAKVVAEAAVVTTEAMSFDESVEEIERKLEEEQEAKRPRIKVGRPKACRECGSKSPADAWKCAKCGERLY